MGIELAPNAVVIIDALSILRRSYYVNQNLKTKNGEYTGALYGFIHYLIKISKYKPAHVIVCSDACRACFRNIIYPTYKETRNPHPQEYDSQIPLMEKFLTLSNIKFVKMYGFEADDLVGTLAKNAKTYGLKPYILSGDTDLYQLVDSETTQLYVSSNEGIVPMGIEEVKSKLEGVVPNQVVDYKALTGDTADNIPGVEGIGKVTARKLLLEYNDLENIFLNIENIKGKMKETLEKNKESAYLSRTLARIKTDVHLDFQKLFKNDGSFVMKSKEASEFLKGLEINLIQ